MSTTLDRPYVPPYAPEPPPREVPYSGFAVASFVLGLVTLGAGSILAIVFGVIARRQIARGERQGRGLAAWGLGLGIVGLVLTVALVAALAVSTARLGGELEELTGTTEARTEQAAPAPEPVVPAAEDPVSAEDGVDYGTLDDPWADSDGDGTLNDEDSFPSDATSP